MVNHFDGHKVLIVLTYFLFKVSGNDWQYIDVQPESLQPTGIVHLFEGASLTIYCGSASPAYWSFDSYRWPVVNRHSIEYRSIKLNNLEIKDSGTYYCYGTNADTRFVEDVQIAVFLNRSYGLSGKVIPSWVEIPENGSVTLFCDSAGPLEWKSLHFHGMQKKIEGKTLTLYNLQKHHSGRYICRGIIYYSNNKRRSIFHNSATIIVDGIVRYIGLNQANI